MLKVQIQDKQYDFPDSWDEIKLHQFKNIMLINPESSELDYKIDMLSELLQCTIEELEVCSLNSLNSLYHKVEILLADKPKEVIDKILILNNKEYYFENDFDKNTNLAMLMDIDKLMKSGSFWENAEQILAIYIRPVSKKKRNYFEGWKGFRKEKYPLLVDLEPYHYKQRLETAKVLLNCPMSYILPISVFFWTLSKVLLENFRTSLLVQK